MVCQKDDICPRQIGRLCLFINRLVKKLASWVLGLHFARSTEFLFERGRFNFCVGRAISSKRSPAAPVNFSHMGNSRIRAGQIAASDEVMITLSCNA